MYIDFDWKVQLMRSKWSIDAIIRIASCYTLHYCLYKHQFIIPPGCALLRQLYFLPPPSIPHTHTLWKFSLALLPWFCPLSPLLSELCSLGPPSDTPTHCNNYQSMQPNIKEQWIDLPYFYTLIQWSITCTGIYKKKIQCTFSQLLDQPTCC